MLDGWGEFSASDEFEARKRADESSYVWDRLITIFHDDHLRDQMEFGGDLDSVDAVTRAMARENRLHRRALSNAFTSFMESSTPARVVMNQCGGSTHFVFLKRPHAEPREDRIEELKLRCLIARGLLAERGIAGQVLGLATEVRDENAGFSIDALLLDIPEWNEDLQETVRVMQDETGYFSSTHFRSVTGSEF